MLRPFAFTLFLLAACGGQAEPKPENTSTYVATTFFPLTEFTRALVGEELEVRCPLPAGEDPVTWQPAREALETFRDARAVISNGAQFEKWLDHASLPDSRHIKTAAAFRERWIEQESITHSHGPGEHTHAGIDGHTWLDPHLARQQAEAIAEFLGSERSGRPVAPELLEQRMTSLSERFDQLDARFEALSPRLAQVDLYASHPAYDYLAQRYGWQLENIEPQDLPASSERPMLMLWEGDIWEAAPPRAVHVRYSPAENPDPEEAAEGYFGIQSRALDGLEAALGELGL